MNSVCVESARDVALALLHDRINYERQPIIQYSEQTLRLGRMRDLLARLGNPHVGVPVVHVAGTKGKGSTASMIAAALTAAGYRTGLFTSPHLEAIEERFSIDGRVCPTQEFIEATETLRPVVAEMDAQASPTDGGPTYFELTTALAWLQFARHKVQAAVMEVGLGGRLDSTNICEPRVSVITSISFDHTRQLGNTLAAIAGEKAGIIKPGVPVVSGVIGAEPRGVIDEVARSRGSRIWQLGEDFGGAYLPPHHLEAHSELGRIDFWRRTDAAIERLPGLELGLIGAHQAANAAVALAALGVLGDEGWNLPEAAIRRGLAEVRCPARVEVIRRNPTVVLDTAHNVASIEALVAALDASFSPRRRVLIFAASKDKDIAGMLRLLLPWFDRVILTCFQSSPRCVTSEQFAELLSEVADEATRARVELVPLPADAWQAARREAADDDDLICITGSFFIAAELRAVIGR